MPGKILFIATSHTRLGNTGRQTGIWAEEIAVPYQIFAEAGYGVDIVSPKGGAAAFDPGSIKPAGQNSEVVERFLSDPQARQKVEHTQLVANANVVGYDAVFFPGGHGAMWDLPEDPHVTRAVEAAQAAGKVIGAVCHGVAALVSARAADGRPMVSGKRVNSFTDDEEEAAGLSNVVPFRLESRLRELGGRFEKAPNWASFAVRDGALVTGQNPASSAQVARLVLQALEHPE
ncbi:type 1 glutamine amidotransferase domain-containing protein [Verminephrobacter aporrectodeae subsp. tuberculatae]|uniref:type 1 glutamine amidotransferase domain-containing protein n=1 Tax=Verminephrobacter aporrectodeae TaxID=1110389 RepID=UPI002244538D|nr:type 1 glutamine amidotransferase domain-containing protein [Verminephrobacter aporrectodeae]MCW8206289.1 type 1 glutamine amidotransferase domain-containing protein [Verminephrobacter aporrectodeae subsp. tuberculatae]